LRRGSAALSALAGTTTRIDGGTTGSIRGGAKQGHELRAKERVHHVVIAALCNSSKNCGPHPHRDRRITRQEELSAVLVLPEKLTNRIVV
jgi:hypothetical protein